MWIRAARCAECVWKKRQISSLTIATKLLFIFLSNPKHRRKPRPRNAPWTFAPRSQSEMTGEICDTGESPLQELP